MTPITTEGVAISAPAPVTRKVQPTAVPLMTLKAANSTKIVIKEVSALLMLHNASRGLNQAMNVPRTTVQPINAVCLAV